MNEYAKGYEDGYRSGVTATKTAIAELEVPILAHKLGCDEYHVHQAPGCCRADCWCKPLIKPTPEEAQG